MLTRQQFYKSRQWEAFRKVIIDRDTDSDGFVHCVSCGKPILNRYDLIVHHKKELNEANVNDAMVALNPDNVECICFKCHNKVHDRFTAGHSASYRPVQKQVYIVYGSPCAGKSTWVHDVATEDDLIVDMDSIWQMISVSQRYKKTESLKSVVFEVRDKLYEIIKYRSGNWNNAYVITGGALKGDRDRLMQRIGGDECIFIDTPMHICISRLEDRGLSEQQKNEWAAYIQRWFETYQSD